MLTWVKSVKKLLHFLMVALSHVFYTHTHTVLAHIGFTVY